MRDTNAKFLRFGLCCIFKEQSIKFSGTTARVLSRLTRKEQLLKLSNLCLSNAKALTEAIEFCSENGIGSFRVLSQIMPLKTHPDCGYDLKDLPESEEIRSSLLETERFASQNDIRLTFHPDQFVVLNSPRDDVVAASVSELLYQAEVAEIIGADVINIHGGGAYGNKDEALKRFERNFRKLPVRVRRLLTIENDDRVYTPRDLLPVCENIGVPLVYDVHHHRCLPDGMSVEETTQRALPTWNREPLFHISSPIEGWNGPKPHRHHDYVDIDDFPDCWKDLNITVEIEAKAKELAITRLMEELHQAV